MQCREDRGLTQEEGCSNDGSGDCNSGTGSAWLPGRRRDVFYLGCFERDRVGSYLHL